MDKTSLTDTTKRSWSRSTSPSRPVQLHHLPLWKWQTTPASPSTIASPMSPVMSAWINQITDSHLLISTGHLSAPAYPSTVLAVVLAGLFIAGCCYFRGRQQCQSCARHTELLHALFSSARHVSSGTHPQSGKYPGPSGNSSPASQDVNHPIIRYSAFASTASCGLPGCATSYERLSLPPLDRAVPSRYLLISHEAVPAVSFLDRSPVLSAIDHKPSAPFQEYGSRQTGINSLIG